MRVCGTFLKSLEVQRLAESEGLAELVLLGCAVAAGELANPWLRTPEAVQMAFLCVASNLEHVALSQWPSMACCTFARSAVDTYLHLCCCPSMLLRVLWAISLGGRAAAKQLLSTACQGHLLPLHRPAASVIFL